MQDLTIRLMAECDLKGADELRRLVGWNQTAEDWARMLRLESDGCFVAILDGFVVGSVTTTTYAGTLAWVGMMLVHPEHRRHGIASRLMCRALQSVRDKNVRCIKLDATPAGFPLYEKLGFATEWTFTRHQRQATSGAGSFASSTPNTRGLRESDWDAVVAIDARAIGASRAGLLRDLAKDSRRACVWPADGSVLGWGLLRPGANSDYLGPVACNEDEGSLSLVAALLEAAEARSVFWDIPDQNPAAQAAAQDLGFVPVRALTRMRLGAETAVSGPQAQFAIADPALG